MAAGIGPASGWNPDLLRRRLHHDANAHRRFDRTMIGLPAEGFGFSNEAPARFGLSRFNSLRLTVPRDGLETGVRLRCP